MNAFAINTRYVNLPIGNDGVLDEGFKCEFSIESTLRELEIRKGADILVLRKNPKIDEFFFANVGVISNVGQVVSSQQEKLRNINGVPREKFTHNFELVVSKILNINNSLSDLEYSLEAVYNYNKPITHFHQQYRGIKKDDFDTITNGWVYVLRTVFGKLVNALPRQNKLEFSLLAMDHFSTIDFKRTSLESGLDFLLNYINGRILNRGRLIVETQNYIEKSLSDILPPSEVGFINPSNGKSNLLSKQASIFKKVFELYDSYDLKKQLTTSIEQNQNIEKRFSEIFKGETWPINLRLRA